MGKSKANKLLKDKGKKERVAVHIKSARQKRVASAIAEAPKAAGGPAAIVHKKKRRRPNVEEVEAADPSNEVEEPQRKDLDEALAYLTSWQQVQQQSGEEKGGGDSSWKFNKNTQSWLIRYIFKKDMLDEKHFDIMCLYLEGLKGAQRDRLLQQARVAIDVHGPDEDEGGAYEGPSEQGSSKNCKQTKTKKESGDDEDDELKEDQQGKGEEKGKNFTFGFDDGDGDDDGDANEEQHNGDDEEKHDEEIDAKPAVEKDRFIYERALRLAEVLV